MNHSNNILSKLYIGIPTIAHMKLFFLWALFVLGQFSFADDYPKDQNWPFEDDRQYLSLGYGYQSYYKTFAQTPEKAYNFHMQDHGPFYVKYEKSILGRLTAGLSASYAQQLVRYDQADSLNTPNAYTSYQINRKAINLLFRLNLHFYTNRHFDCYGGLGLGFRYVAYKHKLEAHPNQAKPSNEPNKPLLFPLAGDMTMGIRFMPIAPLCLYMEFGLSQSILQAGIVFSWKGSPSFRIR